MNQEKLQRPEFSYPPQFESLAELLAAATAMPKGEPHTFGATPLDHPAAYQQQREVQTELQLLVDTQIPEDIPPIIAEYIKDTFAARFQGRSTANQENYLSALHHKNDFADEPELQALFARGELGHASPAEVLIMRQVLGIRSAELACLTHPYGKRIEELAVMRQAVQQNVELLGGVYYDEPPTRYRAKALVGTLSREGDCSNGVLMTRKRTLGVMPDGTIIKERSSFVLRTDSLSAVAPSDVARLSTLDPWTSTWQDDAVEAGRLDEYARILLEENEFSMAIPVSSTIYAHNEAASRAINERDAYEHELRKEAFREEIAAHFPAIAEAMREAQLHPPIVNAEDRNGMLFVGRTRYEK
jgi:hypothetical protein